MSKSARHKSSSERPNRRSARPTLRRRITDWCTRPAPKPGTWGNDYDPYGDGR
jgi:hypothetical protein